jgi:hypothetical protein
MLTLLSTKERGNSNAIHLTAVLGYDERECRRGERLVVDFVDSVNFVRNLTLTKFTESKKNFAVAYDSPSSAFGNRAANF